MQAGLDVLEGCVIITGEWGKENKQMVWTECFQQNSVGAHWR